MSTTSEIMQRVYSSDGFKQKGYSLNLKDAFLVPISAHAYIVFIVERSNLDGSNQSFTYAIYSVEEKSAIVTFSDTYMTVVSQFPPLANLSNAGGKLDFVRKRTLSKQFDALVESYVKHNGLSDDAKSAYMSYLAEMKDLKAPSFKPVYNYFLERARM